MLRNTIVKPRVRNSLIVVSVFGMSASLITMLVAFELTPDDSVHRLALACMGIFLVSLTVLLVAAITEAADGECGSCDSRPLIKLTTHDDALRLSMYYASLREREQAEATASRSGPVTSVDGESVTSSCNGKCALPRTDDGPPTEGVQVTCVDDVGGWSVEGYTASCVSEFPDRNPGDGISPPVLNDGFFTFLSRSMGDNGLATESVSLTSKSLGEEPVVLGSSGTDGGSGSITEKRPDDTPGSFLARSLDEALARLISAYEDAPLMQCPENRRATQTNPGASAVCKMVAQSGSQDSPSDGREGRKRPRVSTRKMITRVLSRGRFPFKLSEAPRRD